MSVSDPSTAVMRCEPAFSESEQITLVGFLAGYRGYTGDAYALDLRQFTAWCLQRGRHLFDVRRVDIECFARDLEDAGKARATVARRLCTVCGFYRYAEEEGAIAHSPGVHIRRPTVDYESHVVALDRNEVGALLVAAGLSSARDHALVSLFALNGPRVSEAVGVDIDALGLERGHRTLTVLNKGGKTVTMPLAPRVARAVDLRSASVPLDRSSSTATGNDWIVTPLGGLCGGSPAAPGSSSASARTRCDMRSSLPPSMPVSHCATCKRPPATPSRERRCVTTGDANPSTATLRMSLPRSSPARHAETVRCSVRPTAAHRTQPAEP
jgi:hypothetical protein